MKKQSHYRLVLQFSWEAALSTENDYRLVLKLYWKSALLTNENTKSLQIGFSVFFGTQHQAPDKVYSLVYNFLGPKLGSYVRTSALSSGAPTGRATNKNNLKQIKKQKSLESPKKILGGQNLWSLWCSFCVMPPMAQIIVEFKKSHNTSYVACHMNIVNHKSYDVLCQLKITKWWSK